MRAARSTTDKTLIVKLSPNVTDIAGIAREAEAAGADALAVINTVRGMAIDVETWRPRLGQRHRRPLGTGDSADRRAGSVRSRARGERFRSSGQGGIETVSDALEFLLAGASAISIGTANFTDPRIPERIVDGLADYLQRRGLSTIAELTGKANVGRFSAAQIRRRCRITAWHRNSSSRSTCRTLTEAERLVDRLYDLDPIFKIGLEALCSYQERIFSYCETRDVRIFVDAKLHDIPRTVAAAIRGLVRPNAKIINVHALGGNEMMRRRGRGGRRTRRRNRYRRAEDLRGYDPHQHRARRSQRARAAGRPGRKCDAPRGARARCGLRRRRLQRVTKCAT